MVIGSQSVLAVLIMSRSQLSMLTFHNDTTTDIIRIPEIAEWQGRGLRYFLQHHIISLASLGFLDFTWPSSYGNVPKKRAHLGACGYKYREEDMRSTLLSNSGSPVPNFPTNNCTHKVAG